MGSQNIFKMKKHWAEYLQDGRFLFQYSIDCWRKKQDWKRHIEAQLAGVNYEIEQLEKDLLKEALEKGYTEQEISAAQIERVRKEGLS